MGQMEQGVVFPVQPVPVPAGLVAGFVRHIRLMADEREENDADEQAGKEYMDARGNESDDGGHWDVRGDLSEGQAVQRKQGNVGQWWIGMERWGQGKGP